MRIDRMTHAKSLWMIRQPLEITMVSMFNLESISARPSDPTIVMKPAEIGRLWAEHYPNRHSDHASDLFPTPATGSDRNWLR